MLQLMTFAYCNPATLSCLNHTFHQAKVSPLSMLLLNLAVIDCGTWSTGPWVRLLKVMICWSAAFMVSLPAALRGTVGSGVLALLNVLVLGLGLHSWQAVAVRHVFARPSIAQHLCTACSMTWQHDTSITHIIQQASCQCVATASCSTT